MSGRALAKLSTLIDALAWNHSPHASTRILNIAAAPRDQMDVAMEDRLPRIRTNVNTNIEARHGGIGPLDLGPLRVEERLRRIPFRLI